MDDVEFWFPPERDSIVEYRSASRLGNFDFDANRKRIKVKFFYIISHYHLCSKQTHLTINWCLIFIAGTAISIREERMGFCRHLLRGVFNEFYQD